MRNYIPELIYEDVTYEYITKLRLNPPGLEQPGVDEAVFSKTDIGRRRDEMLIPFQIYLDAPMHPNVLRYWAERGLKKELFDNDGRYGFDAANEYSVFTPLDMNPARKYALIYFSHGGGQPIEWAEHYGLNTIAAREKYIIVYAQNGGRSNDASEKEFGRILGELKKKGYPIDWERVYAAGFSSGCEATGRIAAAYPDVVAAVGCMTDGLIFRNLPFDTEAANMKNLRMPGVFLGGTVDRCDFPAPWVSEYFGSDLPVGRVENGIASMNAWMEKVAQIENFRPFSYEEVMERLRTAEDPIEREFGIRFDRSFQFHVQGVDWLGGEFYGAEGTPVMRWARAIGIPHMAWESQANLTWDYLKHFRRDPETGRSIYDPVACWGER